MMLPKLLACLERPQRLSWGRPPTCLSPEGPMKASCGANPPKPAWGPRKTIGEMPEHMCVHITRNSFIPHLPRAERAPGSGDRACPVGLTVWQESHARYQSEPAFRCLLCNETFLDLLILTTTRAHQHLPAFSPLCFANLLIYSLPQMAGSTGICLCSSRMHAGPARSLVPAAEWHRFMSEALGGEERQH